MGIFATQIATQQHKLPHKKRGNRMKNILASFNQLYKKKPGHSYSLLVVKDSFSSAYNFYLEEIDGATYSHGLGSIDFDDLVEYKDTLRKLLDSKVKIEYRGF